MELPAIVTVLALVEYLVFGFRVGLGRQAFDVPAPATSGHPIWERRFRVQQNTLEQLVLFLPGLWLFASYVNATLAAAIGLLFLIGRPIYAAAYEKDPDSRTVGFLMGYLANVVLLLGGLGGAVMSLL